MDNRFPCFWAKHQRLERSFKLSGRNPPVTRGDHAVPLGLRPVRFGRVVLFLFRKRCCRRLPALTVGGAPA